MSSSSLTLAKRRRTGTTRRRGCRLCWNASSRVRARSSGEDEQAACVQEFASSSSPATGTRCASRSTRFRRFGACRSKVCACRFSSRRCREASKDSSERLSKRPLRSRSISQSRRFSASGRSIRGIASPTWGTISLCFPWMCASGRCSSTVRCSAASTPSSPSPLSSVAGLLSSPRSRSVRRLTRRKRASRSSTPTTSPSRKHMRVGSRRRPKAEQQSGASSKPHFSLSARSRASLTCAGSSSSSSARAGFWARRRLPGTAVEAGEGGAGAAAGVVAGLFLRRACSVAEHPLQVLGRVQQRATRAPPPSQRHGAAAGEEEALLPRATLTARTSPRRRSSGSAQTSTAATSTS
mmetsp:Transcript_21846/g.70563  ORF Transcript_21846/g.70563 Transcript_21846/m.70563 type:complete len:352 (-) Transcript_21846:3148-4203(-)